MQLYFGFDHDITTFIQVWVILWRKLRNMVFWKIIIKLGKSTHKKFMKFMQVKMLTELFQSPQFDGNLR